MKLYQFEIISQKQKYCKMNLNQLAATFGKVKLFGVKECVKRGKPKPVHAAHGF